MSTLKRKDAPGDHPPSKSVKKTKDVGPSKNDSKSDSKTAKNPVVSLLKDEEPMFPRGGANVLTPLEQKQIQLEAKADAMHEEEFGSTSKAPKTKKKKATSSKKSGSKSDHKSSEDSIKVESLSFKVCR